LFNEKKNTPEFVFRIQIAASRSRMSRRELHRIYNGRLAITESFEDNWYKYTIGLYSSHAEACRLRDQTDVKGVFVASYLNGKRIKISPIQKMQFYSAKPVKWEDFKPGPVHASCHECIIPVCIWLAIRCFYFLPEQHNSPV
jgi:hypothetical protein